MKSFYAKRGPLDLSLLRKLSETKKQAYEHESYAVVHNGRPKFEYSLSDLDN